MMRYALISLWVSFWGGFFAVGQVDPCSEVSPVAAFVNPFDVTQLHLASANPTSANVPVPEMWRGAEVLGLQGQILGHISDLGRWPEGVQGWVVVRAWKKGAPAVARVFVARD
jgi:hypothetical protein